MIGAAATKHAPSPASIAAEICTASGPDMTFFRDFNSFAEQEESRALFPTILLKCLDASCNYCLHVGVHAFMSTYVACMEKGI